VCILAVGKLLEAAEEASVLLADEGVEATLWDVRVVRPLDPAMVADAGRHGFVVTVEDGIRNGGAGNYIADAIADLHPSRHSPPVLNLGIPTAYLAQDKPDRILGQLGLDGPGIAASIFRAIEHVEHLGDEGPAEPAETASDLSVPNGSGSSATNGLVEHLGHEGPAERAETASGLGAANGVALALPVEQHSSGV
jgi:hypothetical protein